jgi:hypothetical protein
VLRALALAAVAVVALGACQSSDVSRELGARCTQTHDCDERCLVPAADYPGGFCTSSCTDKRECPDGATCADRDDGVCLYTCTADPDCAFLGAGWACKDADLEGGGVKVMVCRGG